MSTGFKIGCLKQPHEQSELRVGPKRGETRLRHLDCADHRREDDFDDAFAPELNFLALRKEWRMRRANGFDQKC
jgi:hypothetical protein